MTRHPRIPALAALLLSAGLGLSVFAATGQFRSTDLSGISIEQFEKQLVGCKDPAIWCAYGDKLRSIEHYPAAAKAYQHAIEFQPTLDKARINAGIVLSLSKNADAFFSYVARLSSAYPKLAVSLLECPEIALMRSDPRFEPAASAARAQALD